MRASASPAIVLEVLLGRLNWKDVAAKLSITVFGRLLRQYTHLEAFLILARGRPIRRTGHIAGQLRDGVALLDVCQAIWDGVPLQNIALLALKTGSQMARLVLF